MEQFIRRLKDRKIVQWGLAYLAGAWLLYEVASSVGEPWGISDSALRIGQLGLVLGFLITLVLAWYHGERGTQRVTGAELLILAGVLGVGGVLLAAMSESSGEAPTAAQPEGLATVAVLPFEDLSMDGSRGAAFFAAGLHDELLTRLQRIPGIQVIARTSVMRYMADARPVVKAVAAELGVATVLLGSVMQAGNQMRMSTQLVDGATGRQIWADQWDEDYTVEGALDILTEIATQITGAIEITLEPEQTQEIEALPTESVDAYNAYLQGRAHSLGRSHEEAVSAFQRAVSIDPEFTEAWAAMIFPLELLVRRDPQNAAHWRQLSEEAVTNATRTDPNGFSGLLAQAQFAYFSRRDYDEARRHLNVIEDRWPGETDALFLQATLAKRQGRFRTAVEFLNRLIKLDPANPQPFIERQIAYRYLGYLDEALADQDRAIALAPDNTEPINDRFYLPVFGGDTLEARRYLDDFGAGSPDRFRWRLLLGYLSGDYEAVTRTMRDRGENELRSWITLPVIYHVMGRRDQGAASALQMTTDLARRAAALVDLPAEEARIQWQLAPLYAVLGNEVASLSAIDRARQLLSLAPDAITEANVDYSAAMSALLLGDGERAMASLEGLWSSGRWPSPDFVAIDPLWSDLHADGRFANLIEEHRPPLQR